MYPDIIARCRPLTTQPGKAEWGPCTLEFFFYAPSEDAAANLTSSLRELGYNLYELRGDALPETIPLCVTGCTTLIDDSTEVLVAWYEAMSELAESHGCDFDGYGRPHLDPGESWDSIM